MVDISELKDATENALRDLNELVAELREDQQEKWPCTLPELQKMMASEDTVVAVAKDGERIVGVATLYVVQKIGKIIAYIEDVVVHSDYRGQGLGEKIMMYLIDEAKRRGVRSIGLSSRPARVAGNKLYRKLGFVQKDTNVYRLAL